MALAVLVKQMTLNAFGLVQANDNDNTEVCVDNQFFSFGGSLLSLWANQALDLSNSAEYLDYQYT